MHMSSEFLAKVAEAAKRPRLPSHLFSKEKFCLIRKGLKPVGRCSYEEHSVTPGDQGMKDE